MKEIIIFACIGAFALWTFLMLHGYYIKVKVKTHIQRMVLEAIMDGCDTEEKVRARLKEKHPELFKRINCKCGKCEEEVL